MAATAKLELLLELKNRLKAGLSSAKNTALTELKSIKSKMSEFATNNLEAIRGVTSEIPGLGRAIGLLGNPYALAAAAALAFGAAATKATGMALDWERSLAKVNVTAQLSELGNLSNQLLMIGAKGSTELEQVPEAFNRIISAGLDVNTSLAALEPTLKAAKAGFADIETVAGAGIGVMKSSGQNINVVYDTLFATLNKGNAEFRDIAQYLPKIIPNSRLAGLQLYETAGAFAFLTAQGQTAEQSSVVLMNAFKALSDPRYTSGFKEIGVNVFNSKGEFRGLVPVVEDLQKAMKGLSTEQQAFKFKTIGLDQEARSAFGSMIQNAAELKVDIDFVKNSTGQLNEAVKNSATSTDGWKVGMNQLKVLFLQFGQLFLPIVQKGGELFQKITTKIFDGITAIREFVNQSVFLSDLFSFLGFVMETPFKVLGLVLRYTYEQIKLVGKVFMSVFEPVFQLVEKIYTYTKAIIQGVIGVGNAIPGFFKGDAINVSDAFNKGFTDSMKKSFEIQNPQKQASLAPASATAQQQEAALAGAGDVDLGGAAPTADPTAHQSKSITINIEALHKGNNLINAEGKGMTLSQFEKLFQEMALRTLRDIEASY